MNQGKFGDKLKQARLALKLTTKQVAEEIKIREDFIREFEKSNFSFDLPEVYRRGFLRAYAQYLDLDPETILSELPPPKSDIPTDTIAVESPSAHLDNRDSGIVEERTATDGPGEKNAWYRPILAKLGQRNWQIGLIVATVLLTVWLGGQLFNRRSNDFFEAMEGQSETEAVAIEDLPAKTLALIANDSVQILVRDKETKEKLFSGYLKKGASQQISYRNNIQISFSEGNALNIRKDTGENIRPNKNGVGWIEIHY